MNNLDYFRLAIQYKFLDYIKWYYTLFTILKDGYEDEYLIIKDKKCLVKFPDRENEEIVDYVFGRPVIDFRQKMYVDKEDIPIIEIGKERYLGRIILNYLMIYSIFGTKVKFQENFNLAVIQDDIIAKRLSDYTTEQQDIIIEELDEFMDLGPFLEELIEIFVTSSSKKLLTPPAGLAKFKKDLIDKLSKEHGSNWKDDPTVLAKYDASLKEYDKEYMKDDPTYGVVGKGKLVNIAKKEMFGSLGGVTTTLSGKPETAFIKESINEGVPLDAEMLAIVMNNAREGSFSRGAETMFGGVIAKLIIRAIGSMKIIRKDCGAKKGKKVMLTKSNHKNYTSLYRILSNGKTELMHTKEDTAKLIGKTIEYRTPMECISEDNTRCHICMGSVMGEKENGLSILGTETSDILMAAFMKAMHGSELKVKKINWTEVIS